MVSSSEDSDTKMNWPELGNSLALRLKQATVPGAAINLVELKYIRLLFILRNMLLNSYLEEYDFIIFTQCLLGSFYNPSSD